MFCLTPLLDEYNSDVWPISGLVPEEVARNESRIIVAWVGNGCVLGQFTENT
jgi:hypothetical protein